MSPLLRWALAVAAAAPGLYLAATFGECVARGCSSSRFDAALLFVLALAAAAAALSILAWHRLTPALLALVVPCFAGMYLFEAVTVAPREAFIARVRDEARQDRARGIDAVPQWTPYGYAAGAGWLTLANGNQVIPLTGPSERLVLMCQEGARPIARYQADQFGLNNPPEAWRGETEVLFVGDSYTHGACVDGAAHFAHAIRRQYPGTVNLGYSGNGPLIEFAGLREYATRLRPRQVFWMYDEGNDVLSYSPPSDLDVEIGHPILAKYLSVPGFTQNLYAQQSLVNAGVNQAAASWIAAPQGMTTKQHLLLPTTREVLRDAYVGLRVALPFAAAGEAALPQPRIDQFADIMRMAAGEVGSWGGRLAFVNLPAVLQACLGRDHPSRAAILDAPRRLGVDVIDLEGPLFDLARAEGADAVAAAPSCGGHYSEKAYAVVANVLLDYLQIAQGAPLKPFWSEHARPDGTRQLIYSGHAHDRSKPLRP